MIQSEDYATNLFGTAAYAVALKNLAETTAENGRQYNCDAFDIGVQVGRAHAYDTIIKHLTGREFPDVETALHWLKEASPAGTFI